MTSEQSLLIPVLRRRLTGVKYFLHEERLKRKPSQTSSSNNEIKCTKVNMKEGTGSEILIEKDMLTSNKNETKIRNCTENNEVKLKEQQGSEFEKDTAMPPSGQNARKRKRKKRTLKYNELYNCFESKTYTEDLSRPNNISSKITKVRKGSTLPFSPDSTGSLTQSIFQYKNYENSNTNVKTLQVFPFSLSDDPSSASLEGVTNNLPLPLISRPNSKDGVSLGDKSSTILSNSSTENKNNKTILISSSCGSNMNNVLNVESNFSVLKPYETTVTLTESSKSSEREENSSLSGITLPIGLKKYTCSQLVPTENLISKAKSDKLKTDTFHISLPISFNIPDTSEEENSDTNSNDLKSSPSLLENYCTANEFTFEDGLPQPRSQAHNLSNGIINGTKKLNFKEIQNPESNCKMNRSNGLHNTSIKQASEYTSCQKTISSECDYVTLQSPKNMSKTSSTKFYATPMKDHEIVLDSDNDGKSNLITSKQTSMNLQQEILLQNNDGEVNTFEEIFDPVYSSTQHSLSENSDSSYRQEYINEESRICLGRIIKMVARYYKVPLTECVYILRTNSFNILNALQELQLKRYTNSEFSN